MVRRGRNPSKIFLGLENERHAKSFVLSVFNSLGIEVSSFPEMMVAHEAFYSDPVCHENFDLKSQQDLFSYVKLGLNESEQALYEGLLTLAEASQALQHSNRNKSLGADGLIVEFHCQFWDKLGEPLVSVYNQGWDRGELPESMKASVTRLVHKKDDKLLLKNWRPISLFPC